MTKSVIEANDIYIKSQAKNTRNNKDKIYRFHKSQTFL